MLSETSHYSFVKRPFKRYSPITAIPPLSPLSFTTPSIAIVKFFRNPSSIPSSRQASRIFLKACTCIPIGFPRLSSHALSSQDRAISPLYDINAPKNGFRLPNTTGSSFSSTIACPFLRSPIATNIPLNMPYMDDRAARSYRAAASMAVPRYSGLPRGSRNEAMGLNASGVSPLTTKNDWGPPII
ncbi:putative AC9 transposase [Fusarium oxysporum f. sp. albedinis]|nr:putative AC9 transposase [Fusarium oxysporum f. sp. albedinis]